VFGGRGMSFNICRGTLGSLAMFTATRNASSREPFHRQPPLGFILEIDIGKVLAVPVRHNERFLMFLDRPGRRETAGLSHGRGRPNARPAYLFTTPAYLTRLLFDDVTFLRITSRAFI
jgi:hypothetical protein